jgi:hypothetical protein
MALRRTNTPAFFPVSAHAPRLAIRRQYRPSIASNSGQGRVFGSRAGGASEFSCGGIGGHLSQALSQSAGNKLTSPLATAFLGRLRPNSWPGR